MLYFNKCSYFDFVFLCWRMHFLAEVRALAAVWRTTVNFLEILKGSFAWPEPLADWMSALAY